MTAYDMATTAQSIGYDGLPTWCCSVPVANQLSSLRPRDGSDNRIRQLVVQLCNRISLQLAYDVCLLDTYYKCHQPIPKLLSSSADARFSLPMYLSDTTCLQFYKVESISKNVAKRVRYSFAASKRHQPLPSVRTVFAKRGSLPLSWHGSTTKSLVTCY